MSVAAAIALGLLIALVISGALACWFALFAYRAQDGLTYIERRRFARHHEKTLTKEAYQTTTPASAGTHDGGGAFDLELPKPERLAPMPVDPSNPPSMKNYVHDPAKGRPRRQCYCHGIDLADGPVLWWPMPGAPEVRLFCPEGIMDMEAAG